MKKIATLLIFVFLLSLCGCRDKITILEEYNTPYTICYDNSNGTYSMRIYSSPIMYQENGKWIMIDNTIINNEENNQTEYTFKNKNNTILTFFPEEITEEFLIKKDDTLTKIKMGIPKEKFEKAKKIEYQNLYGTMVSAVIYEGKSINYIVYCTKAGIKCEIELLKKPAENKFNFSYYDSDISSIQQKDDYIIFKSLNKTYSVVYNPVVSDSNIKRNTNNFSLDNTLVIKEKGNGRFNLLASMNNEMFNNEDLIYPLKIDISFDRYLNKLPDTAVFSNKPISNEFLLPYSVIGNSDCFGESMQYVRMRFSHFFETQTRDINMIKYVTKDLSRFDTDVKIGIYSPEGQWSSTQMIWENRIGLNKLICGGSDDVDGAIEFDITEYAKKCIREETDGIESMGIILKGVEDVNECYKVLASSDNALYAPYYEVVFNKLPDDFQAQSEINPPIEINSTVEFD